MSYAAQSEMTRMVYVQQTADLLSVRSQLSVPEPTPDQDMEDSDLSSQANYTPINSTFTSSPRTRRAVLPSAQKRPNWPTMGPRTSPSSRPRRTRMTRRTRWCNTVPPSRSPSRGC
eukprot:7358055-Alexandrium_andersonii.AAC.1